MNSEFEKRVLREQGNIDKLDGLISKAIKAVEDAGKAILQASDAIDAMSVEATAIGGKVASILPSHCKVHISNLTKMVETDIENIINGENQSSLSKLKDFIGNIPYRDLKPQSAEDRRSQISLQPNLANGPQSAIQENSLEEFYERLYEESQNYEYDDNNFSFSKITESNIFGKRYEDDMLEQLHMKKAAPIQKKQIREKIRTAVEDDMFEDKEELQESGPLDFNNLRAFGGSDGMPISFNTLTNGGNMVDNT